MGPKSKNADKRARQEEVNTLSEKNFDLQAQLKEARRVNGKLTKENTSKDQQLADLDETMEREREKYKWELLRIQGKIASEEQSAAKRLQDMAEKEKEILMRISNTEYYSFENELLQVELKEMAFEQFKQAKRHSDAHEHIKQKSFDTRMTLDSVLRDTIKMFTSDYHQQALAKMDLEAANALKDNVRLYSAFDSREETVEQLIKQQKQSYEQLMKIRIEKEVVAATSVMHEQIVSKMEKEQLHCEGEVTQLHDKIQKLLDAIQLAEDKVKKKDTLSQLEALAKQNLAAVKKFRHQNVNDSIKLAKDMMGNGIRGVDGGQSYYGSCIGESFLGSVAALTLENSNIAPRGDSPSSLDLKITVPVGTTEGVGFDDYLSPICDDSHNNDTTFRHRNTSSISRQLVESAMVKRNHQQVNKSNQEFDSSIDYNAVWNSSYVNCQVMNSGLRKLLSMEKKATITMTPI